jgi:hypothetical protein
MAFQVRPVLPPARGSLQPPPATPSWPAGWRWAWATVLGCRQRGSAAARWGAANSGSLQRRCDVEGDADGRRTS